MMEFNDRTQESHSEATLEKYGVLGQLHDDGFVYLYNFDSEEYEKYEEIPEDLVSLVEQKQRNFWKNDLRTVRDQLILETDWWVLPDRTPTQEQLDYRQALRDITQSYSNLNEVVWPQRP